MQSNVLAKSEDVRSHAQTQYVSPARARGEKRFSITVGDVHKALALENRVPLVCAALRSKKFLQRNGLRLVARSGPPSGLSTTVTFTYEFEKPLTGPAGSVLRSARGIARDMFRELGGGEGFIRKEREAFFESHPEPESEKRK